jgi:ribosomal protein L13E
MHHVKAVITKQNGKKSLGRGFSPTELEKAGLNKQLAKQIGIPLDIKRKSVHNENVETLKAHAAKAKSEAHAKPKTLKNRPAAKEKS